MEAIESGYSLVVLPCHSNYFLELKYHYHWNIESRVTFIVNVNWTNVELNINNYNKKIHLLAPVILYGVKVVPIHILREMVYTKLEGIIKWCWALLCHIDIDK